MSSINLGIIIFFSIWILALIVSGILGWVYQIKHKTFKIVREEIRQELIKYKDKINLEAININFELPNNEISYVLIENISVIEIDNKKYIKKFSKQNNFKETENEDSDFAWENDLYKLMNNKKIIWDYDGKLYATNLRIMIDAPMNYIQISYKDIKNLFSTIIYDNKEYYFGFIIYTDNKIYKIKTSDIKSYCKLKKIWKES
ncbi:hypothetical protein [Spiroplasma endosymbiont of Labia minor]|uniref:hypothetical protein n=1 Tax=Spiroplasma endosymbiont of Labia minor TaxID=3066305 RepID=UPI0030D20510